ncbi:MAG: hypothetical protein U9Q83_04045 [Bacteroidota bacterium]|nr:hypothetical protein [Bacteroidota bacterium]
MIIIHGVISIPLIIKKNRQIKFLEFRDENDSFDTKLLRYLVLGTTQKNNKNEKENKCYFCRNNEIDKYEKNNNKNI